MISESYTELAPLDLEAIRHFSSSISDADLGFPAGVQAILTRAFERRMSRSEIWDLRQIPEQEREPFFFAARIFRRGVRTLPAEQARPQPHEGTKIRFGALSADLAAESLPLPRPALLVADPLALGSLSFDLSGFDPSDPDLCLIPASEELKSLSGLARIDSHLKSGSYRSLIALGGGMILDLAGFAAALHGLPTLVIPTTLLAMVDAAHGGKTAVNHPQYGKNQIGLFWPPHIVAIDPRFLDSLPLRELRSGGAECLKHALIAMDLLLLERCSLALAATDQNALAALLPQLCSIKTAIVERDPFEKDERQVLNLGHTIGHALESLSAYALTHGEAVLVGILVEIELSIHLGYLPPALGQQLVQTLKASGCLPTRALLRAALGSSTSTSSQDSTALAAALAPLARQDKKAANSREARLPLIFLSESGCARNPEDGSFIHLVDASLLPPALDRALSALPS